MLLLKNGPGDLLVDFELRGSDVTASGRALEFLKIEVAAGKLGVLGLEADPTFALTEDERCCLCSHFELPLKHW